MWLAENMKHTAPAADAEQGVSTIVGEQMGVVTRERCGSCPVYGPRRVCVDAGERRLRAGHQGRPRR